MDTINHNFIVAADFIDLFPRRISRAQILRQSKERAFPPFVKTSFKAEPLFSRKAVLAWFREKFFLIDPALCAAVEEKLLPSPEKAQAKGRSK